MKAAIICVLFVAFSLKVASAFSIQPRIINGYNATAGQFPWVVSITGTLKSGAQISCNGALISNKTIITVAQCLENIKRVSIGLGSVRRDVPLVHINSQHLVIHPKYNSTTFANNIGIIKLSNPLSFTKFLKPVQLPSVLHRNDPFTNTIATVSGFGRLNDTDQVSSRLQFVKVKILSEKKCQSFYGSLVSNANTMCSLGSEYDSQGACPNDNGSPLVVSEKLTDILIGLVSFISKQGCQAGHPTGYIRVAPYVGWIRDNGGIIP